LNGKRNPLYQRARLPEGAQRSTGGIGQEHVDQGTSPLGFPRSTRNLERASDACRPARVLSCGAAMASRRDAYELLLIEEADAWFEYLEATRGQTELRYKELEPWAWARLSQRLRAIRTKKQKLKPAAAA
jgi:hypothetical protein